jgi:fructoselysine 6-kinase
MRVLTLGDNVVDHYRERRILYPGGNAVNVAVAASRAGAHAAYIGRVGADAAGRHVLDALRSEGVDTSRTEVVDGPNAVQEVSIVDGERVFGVLDLGVSMFHLVGDDLRFTSGFDVAHTGDLGGLETQIAELAQHVPVSFDFSTRHDERYLAELAPHLDVAFFSGGGLDRREAESLACAAAEKGVSMVVVTGGAGPVCTVHQDDVLWHNVPPAEPLDTLGAGDSFIGRFLVGWAAKARVEEAVAMGVEAAQRTCMEPGGFGHALEY